MNSNQSGTLVISNYFIFTYLVFCLDHDGVVNSNLSANTYDIEGMLKHDISGFKTGDFSELIWGRVMYGGFVIGVTYGSHVNIACWIL